MPGFSELERISSAIHDEYFELARLVHDVDKQEMRLPLFHGRRTKRGWLWTVRPPTGPSPTPLGTLIVRHAVHVHVEDDAEIGWYDVNSLAFDPANGNLRIISNVPCEIVVHCDELEVELVSGDRSG